MDRGSDTHGPMQDDYLNKELRGLEQADHPTRAEEWRDPEPAADDDPLLGDPRGTGDLGLTTVADLMTPEVISVSSAASVAEVAAVRRVLVVGTDDRPRGVISLGDLTVAQGPWSALSDIVLAQPPSNAEDERYPRAGEAETCRTVPTTSRRRTRSWGMLGLCDATAGYAGRSRADCGVISWASRRGWTLGRCTGSSPAPIRWAAAPRACHGAAPS